MRTFLVAAVTLATFTGCVDQGGGPQPKKVDPGFVGKHLLQAPPANLTAKLDVDLGGKVVYLGNTVNVERAVPGQAFKITHYWKVIAPVGPGWRVFSQLRGEPTKPDFMNLMPTEMQGAHGPATWVAGEIIEDEQEIFLRPDWRSIDLTLYIGLVEVGAHGIGDRLAASGPNVKDRAVVARRLEIDLAKAPPPPGTLHVGYAQGPIVIDGTAADQGWMNVAASAEWPTAEGSPEQVGKAIGKLTWNDDHLYVYVNVTDPEVFSEFKNQDDPLWKQDCVELFIDADGNRRGYVELQVNPNNVTFDSWFPGGRAAKGDEEWDSGMITAVKLNPGQGWEVEIAIPWAAVKGREDAMSVRLPPQVGDRWRMNVVRVDKKQGAQNPTASSWNRISYQDWHGLDRMLTVVFADQAGGVAPGTLARPPVPGAVDPGVGSGSAAGITSPTLTIELATNGTLRANGAAITDAKVEKLFAAAYAQDKQTRVVVAAEPAVPHAKVISLLDRAKLAGLTLIAVTPPAPAAGSASGSAAEREPPAPRAGSASGSAAGNAAVVLPPANEMRMTKQPADIRAGSGSAASGSSAPPGAAGSGSAR